MRVAGSARRRRHRPLAGCDRGEDRIQPFHGDVVTTDHQAVTTLQAEDTTRCAAVDVVDLLLGEVHGARDVVAVVRVAAVDQGVAGCEQWNELVDCRLHDRRGKHDPHVARRLELVDEVGE